MKQGCVLLIAAWIAGCAGCATTEPGYSGRLPATSSNIRKFEALFRSAAELRSATLQDIRAEELIKKLESEINAAQEKAAGKAEEELLRHYRNAAEAYRLALLRKISEAAQAQSNESSGGLQSAAGLWSEATDQLREAQERFFFGNGLRKFEPIYMDPPMKWRGRR